VALAKALDLFRKDGFAATSLDDLSAATGMNRPSLYGAFGDKRELYIKSHERYRADARAAMADIFRKDLPIKKRLARIFAVALDIYLSGEAGPRGCFTVMTAASEAVADPQIRAMVLEGFTELDKAFAACFRIAKEKRELPASADPVVLAQLASATIHTIAIRARAQVPRKELEGIVKGAIEVMCGGSPTATQ
jgi:AcrR family transcriptional regulator